MNFILFYLIIQNLFILNNSFNFPSCKGCKWFVSTDTVNSYCYYHNNINNQELILKKTMDCRLNENLCGINRKNYESKEPITIDDKILFLEKELDNINNNFTKIDNLINEIGKENIDIFTKLKSTSKKRNLLWIKNKFDKILE